VTFGPSRAALDGRQWTDSEYQQNEEVAMKLIALAAVAALCLLLIAGKDDIKRFQRMRSM
jgi:hypothetical protein